MRIFFAACVLLVLVWAPQLRPDHQRLADLMDYQVNGDAVDLQRDIDDLRRAVGLEQLPRRKPRPEVSARSAALP